MGGGRGGLVDRIPRALPWAGGLSTVGAQPLPRQRRIDPIAQGNALGHLSSRNFPALKGRHPFPADGPILASIPHIPLIVLHMMEL